MGCLLRDSTAAENAKKKQGEKDNLIKRRCGILHENRILPVFHFDSDK